MLKNCVLVAASILILTLMFLFGCGDASRPLVSLDELSNPIDAKSEVEVVCYDNNSDMICIPNKEGESGGTIIINNNITINIVSDSVDNTDSDSSDKSDNSDNSDNSDSSDNSDASDNSDNSDSSDNSDNSDSSDNSTD